jgi:uroporphyrinogen decarboxylase
MRQAGRYLPEYQALRAHHDFLQLCHSPELAVEVTLQPIRRYHMDVAVVFSDILVIPEAMGQTVAYPKGGPTLEPPVRSAADLRRLKPVEPAAHLDYVAESLRLLRRELGDDHALLGFAGAPYTLATYMVEGATSRHQAEAKRLAFTEPGLLDELLVALADNVAAFLRLQVEAGVDAVQIFDTWAGDLAPRDFERLARRPTRRVVEALADLDVPIIYYVNGIASHLEAAERTGAGVLSIDWRLDLAEAHRRTGGRVALQGNLDPLYLQAPPDAIRRRVREIHASLDGAPGHIFNLGHGVLPHIPLEGVAAFVEAVQELGHA